MLFLLERLLEVFSPCREGGKIFVTLQTFRIFLQLWGPMNKCVENVARTLLPRGLPPVTWFNHSTGENAILEAMAKQPGGTFVVSVAEFQPPWSGSDQTCCGRFVITFVSEEEGEPRSVKRGYFTHIPQGILTGSRRLYPTLREAVAAFGGYCTTPLRL